MTAEAQFYLEDSSFDQDIAEYLALILAPEIKEKDGPWKQSGGSYTYQLDSGNNWFYNIHSRKKDTRAIIHRYNNIKVVTALRDLVLYRFHLAPVL